MKKKLLLMGIAGALVVTAIIGGTLASFSDQTDSAGITNINTKALSIALKERQQKEVTANAVPGAIIDCPYFVVNDTENGYELYTRVTIYKKWAQETDGKVLEPSKVHLYAASEENMLELKTNSDGTPVTIGDWIVWYSDDEQVILYYKKPLQATEKTSNVIDFVKVDSDIDNSYADKEMFLEFEAESVQTSSADKAMLSEWGVYPIINADGVITGIEE